MSPEAADLPSAGRIDDRPRDEQLHEILAAVQALGLHIVSVQQVALS